MRIHLNDYYNEIQQRLLKLGKGKITSPSTNGSSAEIEIDDRLGDIVHRLEHI